MKDAFTLVELLVVIAIICLLFALLFPVIIGAKGRALQSVCMANLEQVGIIIHLYAMDKPGQELPPGDGTNPGQMRLDVAAQLDEYMKDGNIPHTIWYCPTNKHPRKHPDLWMNPDNHWNNTWHNKEFPIGYYYFGNPQSIMNARWIQKDYKCRYLHQCSNRTILMIDENQSREKQSKAADVMKWWNYPHYNMRHPMGSNILMGDLHVEFKPIHEQKLGFAFWDCDVYVYW
jgi:prepilin-type N-terminal cleavage/methylation domain-containing protein/prepilin-type processing-associated H-X9-DG protein